MKKLFANFYVKTLIGIILTGIIGLFMNHLDNKITNNSQKIVSDSSNAKNIHDQFWDLFSDQMDKNKRLQAEIDSLKDCCRH